MLKPIHCLLNVLVFAVALSATAVAQDDSGTPKSLKDDYLVGTWRVTGKIDGEQRNGTMRVRTGADDTCFVFDWVLRSGNSDPLIGTAIGGHDPATNRFAEYCFESTGSHFINRYELRDDDSDLGIANGKRAGIIKGQEYEGQIVVNRQSKDRFIYTVTSAKGEDVRLVFERGRGREGKKRVTK